MLNKTMLDECKDVIFNQSGLSEPLREPVHMAIKNLIVLEYAYEDFLSRENSGTGARVNPLLMLIDINGGDSKCFLDWFMTYENATEEQKAAGTAPSWGT